MSNLGNEGESEEGATVQTAAWVQDPPHRRLCTQRMGSDFGQAYATVVFGVAGHSLILTIHSKE